MKRVLAGIVVAFLTLTAQAQDSETEKLRREIEALRAELEAQLEELDEKSRRLDALEQRAASSESGVAPGEAGAPPPAGPPVGSADNTAAGTARSSGSNEPANEPGPSTQPFGSLSPLLTLPRAQAESVLESEPIAGLGRGEEFIDPEFLKSVPLFGSEWRFSFGGYLKADMILDFSGTEDERQFVTSGIPVDGEPPPGSYFHLQISESRFHFEVQDTSEDAPPNKVYLELDFFGSDPLSPRLRHFYFERGHLLAGRTWTTLTELRQLPFLLDFAAGDSLYGNRTEMIRWQRNGEDWDWAVAIENYDDGAISNPDDLGGTARSYLPLVVGRMSYDWGRGVVTVGGSVGQNRWDGNNGVGDATTVRWSVVTGGRVYLDSDLRHYLGFGASYGEGAPGAIISLAEAGTPSAVLQPDGSLENVASWNVTLGLHVKWSNKFSSNFAGAYAEIDPVNGLGESASTLLSSFHGNLIWEISPRMRAGIEYMYGYRQILDGSSGEGHRLQMSVIYYF